MSLGSFSCQGKWGIDRAHIKMMTPIDGCQIGSSEGGVDGRKKRPKAHAHYRNSYQQQRTQA